MRERGWRRQERDGREMGERWEREREAGESSTIIAEQNVAVGHYFQVSLPPRRTMVTCSGVGRWC